MIKAAVMSALYLRLETFQVVTTIIISAVNQIQTKTFNINKQPSSFPCIFSLTFFFPSTESILKKRGRTINTFIAKPTDIAIKLTAVMVLLYLRNISDDENQQLHS